MSVCYMHAWYPGRREDGIGCQIGIIDSCESPYGCWESNLGPLQEKEVLLRSLAILWPSSST